MDFSEKISGPGAPTDEVSGKNFSICIIGDLSTRLHLAQYFKLETLGGLAFSATSVVG